MKIHEVESAFLKKLGADKDNSGHHIYFYLEYKGNEYTVGKLSHSWSGDLNDTQIIMLARKLHLKKIELEHFVDCSLSASQMLEIWQERRKNL